MVSVTALYSLTNFLMKAIHNDQIIILMKRGLFRQVLGSIHKFYYRTSYPATLICKWVQQVAKEGWNYSKIHKRRGFFSLLWQPSALGGNPPCLLHKNIPLSVWLAKKGIPLDTHLKVELTVCFESCQGIPCINKQSRKTMGKTLLL